MSVHISDLEKLYDEVQPIVRNEHRADARYGYAKVRQRNEWFIVKMAESDELRPNLQNERLWCEFMERVDVLAPAMHLKGPTIVRQIGEDALVFKYIDAPTVAVRGDASAWRTHLQRYTDTLLKLDTLANDFSLSHIYTKLNHPYELDNASWRQWVEGNVDAALVEQAKKLFKKYEWNVTLRLQHNDMSPWQIFEQGDDWIIIDGEKANLQSPRFNDVARSYVRMHNTVHDATLAGEFLTLFTGSLGMDRDEFYKQFIPVLTMSAIKGVADTTIDNSPDSHHQEALALVDKCLSEDITRLLQ